MDKSSVSYSNAGNGISGQVSCGFSPSPRRWPPFDNSVGSLDKPYEQSLSGTCEGQSNPSLQHSAASTSLSGSVSPAKTIEDILLKASYAPRTTYSYQKAAKRALTEVRDILCCEYPSAPEAPSNVLFYDGPLSAGLYLLVTSVLVHNYIQACREARAVIQRIIAKHGHLWKSDIVIVLRSIEPLVGFKEENKKMIVHEGGRKGANFRTCRANVYPDIAGFSTAEELAMYLEIVMNIIRDDLVGSLNTEFIYAAQDDLAEPGLIIPADEAYGWKCSDFRHVHFEGNRVLTFPRSNEAFARSLKDLSHEGYVGTKADGGAVYVPEMKLVVAYDGRHHAGVTDLLHKDGEREMSVYSIADAVGKILTNGVSWFSEDGKEIDPVLDDRLALLFSFACDKWKLEHGASVEEVLAATQ